MFKYPKINTLFNRVYTPEEIKIYKAKKNPIVEDKNEYSREEFKAIDRWTIQEKVDGMNIRILKNGEVRGRTDQASIPPDLLKRLNSIFTIEKLQSVFGDKEVILFGEGYGKKIQACGEKYLDYQDFILFDVWINGIWCNRDALESIAESFSIKCVPLVFRLLDCHWNKEDIISFIKSKPNSFIGKDLTIEGIVAKPDPILLFQNGDPVYFKLKCKDFE